MSRVASPGRSTLGETYDCPLEDHETVSEATLDIRALPDENMPAFYDLMRKITQTIQKPLAEVAGGGGAGGGGGGQRGVARAM